MKEVMGVSLAGCDKSHDGEQEDVQLVHLIQPGQPQRWTDFQHSLQGDTELDLMPPCVKTVSVQ